MKQKTKLLVIMGASFVLLAVAAGFGMQATSKPGFCAGCHQIQPAVTAWEKGAHSTVDCLTCHSDPGLAGKIKTKIGGVGEVFIQLTGAPGPDALKADVPAERCLSCHKKIEPEKKEVRDLHKRKDINCGPCHRQEIHKKV